MLRGMRERPLEKKRKRWNGPVITVVQGKPIELRYAVSRPLSSTAKCHQREILTKLKEKMEVAKFVRAFFLHRGALYTRLNCCI